MTQPTIDTRPRQVATCPVCHLPVPGLLAECGRTKACRDESAGDDLAFAFRAGLK